jgi:hypothetical protein
MERADAAFAFVCGVIVILSALFTYWILIGSRK